MAGVSTSQNADTEIQIDIPSAAWFEERSSTDPSVAISYELKFDLEARRLHCIYQRQLKSIRDLGEQWNGRDRRIAYLGDGLTARGVEWLLDFLASEEDLLMAIADEFVVVRDGSNIKGYLSDEATIALETIGEELALFENDSDLFLQVMDAADYFEGLSDKSLKNEGIDVQLESIDEGYIVADARAYLTDRLKELEDEEAGDDC